MYGKFFSSTFTGSMYGAGATVFAVWGYVIANTIGSTVELNPKLLSAILGTPVNEIESAIGFLCQPDIKSRNPDQEGRRLVSEGAFLYHVVSHEIYRAIRDEDDRRKQNREAQRRHRAKQSSPVIPDNADSNHSKPGKPKSAHTEAEAYTEVPSPVLQNGNGSGHKKNGNGNPKHTPFKELIFKCYEKLNDGQAPPWDGSDAKQLDLFLRATPSLTIDTWRQWLTNYYYSKDHPPGLRPRVFIPKLCNYSTVINKFNREDEAK